jgi:AbrB family looped-hinge helix DNA binding protein
MFEMAKAVVMDRKGRLVVPKDVREAAGIKAPASLVIEAEGEGRVALYSMEKKLERARQIGKKKLAGWVEEKHEATRFAERLVEGKAR